MQTEMTRNEGVEEGEDETNLESAMDKLNISNLSSEREFDLRL